MTKEEFQLLSTDQQDEFVSNGGVITLSKSENKESVTETTKADQQSLTTRDDSRKVEQTSLLDNSISLVPEQEKQQMGSSHNGLLSLPLSEPKDGQSAAPSVFISQPTFDIENPLELLLVFDEAVRTGKVTLHDWQVQFLLDFAEGGETDTNPFQSVVRACNGSGKDKYIIAPCAVWLNMRYYRARGIVTSSSGVQLDNQTCAYIEQLALATNRKFGTIWKCNYRYYECLPTESPIICYATDEPGKAEGFHPLEYGAKMSIFASEDKSIPDEINTALNKCTGYTHRVHVSTPGIPVGHFFDLCSSAIPRKELKTVKEAKSGDYIEYYVTAQDCPHLSKSYIEQMKRDLPGGEHGAAYKSQVLAEFGTTDEMVVIPYTYVWKAFNKTDKDWKLDEHNKAGLDLSDGGDETVLVVRNGNKVIKVLSFRFDNTEDTIAYLNDAFKDNDLCHKDALIFADCGGLGKPMLDRMKRQGWSNIRYVDNRSKPYRPKVYKNRGAEIWFQFGELMKQGQVIIPRDDRLVRQLSTRYYKIIDGAIHQLLSKLESRSRGFPSPDRADACVLAFSNYESTYEEKFVEAEIKGEEEEEKLVGAFDLRTYAKSNDITYMNSRYVINGGQKDFSEIESEISEHNKRLKLVNTCIIVNI